MTLPEVRPTNPGGVAGSVAGAAEKAATGAAGGIKGALGPGGTAEQFLIWNVLSQIVGAALTPAISDIVQGVNTADPVSPHTPEQLAVAVVREIIDPGNAQSEAAKSGIGPGRFQELITLAMSPPSLGLILAAYQRQQGEGGPVESRLVDIDKALADLGIDPKYWPMVKGLSVNLPTQEDVFTAWLEGQIEPAEATARLLATGLDPSWIQSGYNSRGQAPTPVQALELWNRGIITENGTGPESTSYQQAFLEGPWRNKWLDAFKALRFYLPPPRTVTAMLKEGALTEPEAVAYLKAQGLDETLIAIYINAASHHTTAAQRELTQAQVIGLYEDHLITADQAVADLVALRFTESDAKLLIALADHKSAAASVKSAVTRLRTLYLAGTNDAATTSRDLHALGLTDDNVAALVATWNLEQASVVRTLTESQIVGAWHVNAFAPDAATNNAAALSRLKLLGYSSDDAMILLVTRNKGQAL